ncbi:hypothetical protein CPB86DRAFT_788354 [Serendipita vermifera]|nr:hypothetical protein CPB86DRAFT_788354 [Serendipita vermifera]
MRSMLRTTLSWVFVAVISCITQAWAVASADRITWTACEEAPSPFECTTMQVPLDWADRRKGLIPLTVIRLPATTQPRQGYMFMNPGGPGSSGTLFLAQHGNSFQTLLGASWDILSWDPRGVFKSGPTISLFSSDEEYANFWKQIQGLDRLDARGNLTTPSDIAFFKSQASAFDTMAQSFNTMMIQKNGDNLKYIGSCAATRDLVAMVEAIYGRGADVNFWGVSYGTVIATYLTQMFPDRVGKVIIDGVFDPYLWSNKVPMDWIETDMEGTEKALVTWTGLCATHPDKCSLAARGNNTAEGIQRAFTHALDVAYHNYDGTKWIAPLDGSNPAIASNPKRWSFTMVSQQMSLALYDERLGSFVSDIVDSIISEQSNINGTALQKRDLASISSVKRFLPYTPPFSPGYGILPSLMLSMVQHAIACGDTIDYRGRTTEQLFDKIIKTSQTTSRNFASTIPQVNIRTFCHRWTSRAVERLPKTMNIKPKNVVLVIGNTEDPITPYTSARSLASSGHLGNKARLVKFKFMGHGTSPGLSSCLDDVIKKFVGGQPPRDARNDEADVECSPDQDFFGELFF